MIMDMILDNTEGETLPYHFRYNFAVPCILVRKTPMSKLKSSLFIEKKSYNVRVLKLTVVGCRKSVIPMVMTGTAQIVCACAAT